MIYQEEQLQKAFDQLPEPIQDYIMSSDVDEPLTKISQEYGIIEEEKFREIVFGLLTGIFTKDQFISELEQELSILPEIGNDIFSVISENIISQLQELFQEIIDTINEIDSIQPIPDKLVGQEPEPVHTLDLEIPPLNLPMIESQEEHDRLVAERISKQHSKPAQADSYNERVQSAASTLASMLQSRNTNQPSAQSEMPVPQLIPNSSPSQNPILEKSNNELPTQSKDNNIPDQLKAYIQAKGAQSQISPTATPKFSYHDKDPYREPPEP